MQHCIKPSSRFESVPWHPTQATAVFRAPSATAWLCQREYMPYLFCCACSTKMLSERELAEVKAAAELELKSKLLEAAQAELGRAQAELSKRESAVAAAEQAARSAAASARDRAAASQAATADADRAIAAQRQQLQQVGWVWVATLSRCLRRG